MKINQQFQALHKQNSDIDWVQIQKIEKDICLFYHQLADYSYIMEDLYYGDVFSEKYWNFLNIQNLENDRAEFIANGCMLIIYAMQTELIEGAGSYLLQFLDETKNAVLKTRENPLILEELKKATILGFEIIEEKSDEIDSFMGFSSLLHDKVVKAYFHSISKEFETNPYFQKNK